MRYIVLIAKLFTEANEKRVIEQELKNEPKSILDLPYMNDSVGGFIFMYGNNKANMKQQNYLFYDRKATKGLENLNKGKTNIGICYADYDGTLLIQRYNKKTTKLIDRKSYEMAYEKRQAKQKINESEFRINK